MRRRIVAATLLAAVLAITLFGVPLAVGVARYYLDDERAELERLADATALAVSADLVRATVPAALPDAEEATDVALYRPDGRKLLGVGPSRLDSATAETEPGQVVSADDDNDLVLAVAVSDGGRVLGVVRAATPRTEVYQRTALTWLGMAALGALAIAATWAIAHRQARRMTTPLEDLSSAATRLGHGDFTVRTTRSGIQEIDSVGSSLDSTAQRLSELLARERAFSADASHQLRTPLAGLRLQLESALDSPQANLRDTITAGLATTDRLERTIDDLLALARDARPDGGIAPLGAQLAELEQDWHGLLAEQGRALRMVVQPEVADSLVSAPVLRQILTVLLDNALRHGRGTVTVAARDVGEAVAVDVTDEGAGVDVDTDPFRRREDTVAGHGIGLALARRLAEAEGGRLRLAKPTPPTFTLLLPTFG